MAQAGSIEHVIDLAAKYDDLPIGDEGFIFQYAKGIRRYQAARDRHEGVGADATRPTEDGVARRDYTEAASLFARALAAPDAGRSPRQRDECRLNHGLSLYYSGEFAQAAFELAKLSESEFDRVRDEAVWMRVVALDTGVEVEYLATTAEALAAERPGAFHTLTCLEMLEHVPDYPSTVQACADLVAPGGQLFFSTINRNPKSYLLAVVGAEYVLGLLPKGTHDYGKFIRPHELADAVRRAGLVVQDVRGMRYNPFTRNCTLCDDVDVNYLLHASKP
jgi:SAM-dependent methyltransferase